MNLIHLAIYLLFANMLAHFIQYARLRQQESPSRWAVLIFADINLILAVLLLKGFDWANYLAIIFALIGFLGLLATLKNSTGYKTIDRLILVLNALILGIMTYVTFLL